MSGVKQLFQLSFAAARGQMKMSSAYSDPTLLRILPTLPDMLPTGRTSGTADIDWYLTNRRVAAHITSPTERTADIRFPARLQEATAAGATLAASEFGDVYREVTLPAGKTVTFTVRLAERNNLRTAVSCVGREHRSEHAKRALCNLGATERTNHNSQTASVDSPDACNFGQKTVCRGCRHLHRGRPAEVTRDTPT